MNAVINVVQNVIGKDTIQTVNARELHKYLQVGRVFAAWITGRIEKFGFVEGEDYCVAESLSNPDAESTKSRSQVLKEYHISLDMAKELSMVENNDKGRAARKFFIECEKKLNDTSKGIILDSSDFNIPKTYASALRLAADLDEKLSEATLLLGVKDSIIEKQMPAVDFVDAFVKRGLNQCITTSWKGLGLKPNLFSEKLRDDGVLYKRQGSSTTLAKQSHIDAGHFVQRFNEFGSQTLVTPAGLLYIAKRYKDYISEHSKLNK